MGSQLGRRMTIRSSTLVYTCSSSPMDKRPSWLLTPSLRTYLLRSMKRGIVNVMLDEIIGHQTNGKELKQQDAFITHKSGMRQQCETTIRWEILLRWKE
jgi:hypothetical protein